MRKVTTQEKIGTKIQQKYVDPIMGEIIDVVVKEFLPNKPWKCYLIKSNDQYTPLLHVPFHQIIHWEVVN
jgi:hypothetical protein